MTYVKGVVLVAIAVVVPAAIAHAFSSLNPNRASGIPMVALLEAFGFAFLMATMRPRVSVAIAAGLFYFPLVFILIFEIGVRGGYYDFP